MTKRMWIPKPKKKTYPKVPDLIKAQVKSKADTLIENVLKPKHIKPSPKDTDLNYLVDIFSKWHGRYFYFCSRYNCPSPRALSPSFEDKFARLKYVGRDLFNLAFKRHTGQWIEIFSALSMEECFGEIKEGVHFMP